MSDHTCKYPTQQQLRAMALRAQLLAIDAQASALTTMDREHSFGVEASYQLERNRRDVHDFVRDVLAFAEHSQDKELPEANSCLCVLVRRASDLKTEFKALQKSGTQHAQWRFRFTAAASQVPSEVVEAAPTTTETVVNQAPEAKPITDQSVPVDVSRLQMKADFACLRAEVDEFAALELQVHALCNLALEYCFTEAVKCTRCSVG